MTTSWDDLPLMLTPPEAMDVLQIGRTLFYDLVRQNRIPHIRLGRAIRIPREQLRQRVEASIPSNPPAVAMPRTPQPKIDLKPVRGGLPATGTNGRRG
jgi:excisionase family DNA binding protein